VFASVFAAIAASYAVFTELAVATKETEVLFTASTTGIRAIFTVPDAKLSAFAAIAMALVYAAAAFPVIWL
jgi:hypothetical protein